MRSAITVLLLTLSILLSAQHKMLDSLYVLLKNHPQQDTARVDIMIQLCHAEHTSNPEKNKELAEEALHISEKLKYTYGIGRAYKYISAYYWAKGDYEQAAAFAFKMLKVYEDSHNDNGMADSYSMLGLVHTEWRTFVKAEEYYLKALAINQRTGRTRNIAYNYNDLGSLCYSFNKYDEAIKYYRAALAIRKQLNDAYAMTQSYITIASLWVATGSYDSALTYFNKALPQVNASGDQYRKYIVLMGLGEIYKFTKQYVRSDSTFKEALVIAGTLGNKKLNREIYHELVLLETARTNYKKALEYALLENTFQDSLFTEEKTKQLAAMEARYETDKKEQAIQLLERDNRIQAMSRNILAGSLGVIVLAGAFYYYVQRQQRKKNRELLKAQEAVNQKLREVDAMRSQFFASISHEFRTPLTLIKGPVEAWLQHPQEVLTEGHGEMILRNSNRLLRLVNQLLDLSRLDSGNLQLDLKDGDLAGLMRVIGSSFGSYAQQHDITYNTQIPETPLFVSFDHDKLETIVYNLLSNAFKFTPNQGKVDLKASYEASVLTIAVADNGRGIGPQHLPRIFDRFYQAEDQAGSYEGTGIGLSLVKELVSLMHGTIEVQSEEGSGTTFTVRLPLQVLSAPPEKISLPGSLFQRALTGKEPVGNDRVDDEKDRETILVVEDNTDMRNFIAERLRSSYAVRVAMNGREALEIAFNEIPDLIITDIMMPQMDGMAFCEAIKNDERTSHIPVIMLTAKEGRENKLEGLETGADDYITKPFDARELQVRTRNLIAQRHQLRKKFSQQITLEPKSIAITSIDRRFLEKVEKAIEDNLAQPEFGVPQLQDLLAMSKTQLHRKMKALTDQPPGEFLRNYRLKRASQLLEQQGGNVTEVAFAVGFGSLSYFTRSFKELYGQSPSDYMKSRQISG